MPFFMNPMAFYAALGALGLLAIYFFRRQAKDVKVSSLMFFGTARVPAHGGRRATWLQTPLILLVELLILTLLVIAAADPRALSGEELMPLVVVLDDSYSMNAGSLESPREKAIKFLEKNFLNRKFYRISLIKAGVKPEFIGRHAMLPREAAQLLGNWRCNSPDASLDQAIRLGGESFKSQVRQLVLTDAAPLASVAENISWYSFGEPVNNLAITGASRYALGSGDRCFIEFANLSPQPARLQAEIRDVGNKVVLEKIDTRISGRAVRRLRFSTPHANTAIKAEILNDKVGFDNEVWLLPVRKPAVKVSIANLPASLSTIMKRTIGSLANAVINENEAEVAFLAGDSAQILSSWPLKVVFSSSSKPLLARGLVTQDKTHPICDGLPDVRAAWAIARNFKTKGYPLLTIGNNFLLSLSQASSGDNLLSFNYAADYSNLHQTTFWPVLFFNIFSWQQSRQPGPVDFNYRSGTEVKLNAAANETVFKLQTPSNKELQLPIWRQKSSFTAFETGLYQLSSKNASWTIAVNLLSTKESDLTERRMARPAGEQRFAELMQHSSDVRWWFIVPAILLMLLHQWLINRRKQKYVY